MKKILLFLAVFLACNKSSNFTEVIIAPVSKKIGLENTIIRYCGMPSDSVYSIKPAWARSTANIYLPINEKTVKIYGLHYVIDLEIIDVKPMYMEFKLLKIENLNK